jgi:hypothetical protein
MSIVFLIAHPPFEQHGYELALAGRAGPIWHPATFELELSKGFSRPVLGNFF